MKITGPGQPPTPIADDAAKPIKSEGAGSVAAKEPVTPAATTTTTATPEAGKSFAETVAASGPAATSRPAPTAAAGSAVRPGGVSVRDLAADLDAGKLDARAVVDELVDRVLASQLGGDAPAGVRDQVRAALEDALDSDPFLADKIRQLGD